MDVEALRRADALHDRAMEECDLAELAARADPAAAECHLRRAFELDRDAADHMSRDSRQQSTTRAIYHRSAAALAIEAGELLEAARLIHQGLQGWCSPRDRADLEELRQHLPAYLHRPRAQPKRCLTQAA